MERLQGFHSNHNLYVDQNNYLYRVDRRRNNNVYFRCRVSTCFARAVQRYQGNILRFSGMHNHTPDIENLNHLRFVQALRSRAVGDNGPLHGLYVGVEVEHHEAALATGGFFSMRGMMYRARRIGTPAVPRTLRDADAS